jgi:hypothetical protein
MPSEKKNDANWWEGAKDHRFALDLGGPLAKYHLQMLEKALVIEQAEGGWRATPTGQLYLKYVEAGS